MPGLKRVVADIPKPCHPNVANRQPALERVMASAMQQVRDANGGHSRRRLQASKSCRIVDHVVGKKNFLSASCLKVARRRVIHAPSEGDSGKEEQIGTIPERVFRRCGRDRLGCWNRGQRGLRGIALPRFGR